MLDVDRFVARCVSAAAGSTPVEDLRELVQEAVADPRAAARVLGSRVDGSMGLLHVSDDLVIQRAVFPKGFSTGIHEHRLWTISGTYAGTERHALFRVADATALEPLGVEEKHPGELAILPPDVAHDVTSAGEEHLCVLHVYVGNLFASGAGEWDAPDATRREFTDVWLERLIASLDDAGLVDPGPG